MTSLLTEQRLDELLAEAQDAVEYPATPNLGGRVLATVASEPSGGATWPVRRFAMAAVVAVVVALVVSLSAPPTRTAIGEFFGLVEGERIERATATPQPTLESTQPSAVAPTANPAPTSSVTPAPTPSPTPPRTPKPPTRLEDIGEPTTLAEAEAEAEAGFGARLPRGAREPVAVYLVRYQEFPVIVLKYEAFDLWEAFGTGFGYFSKTVPAEAVIETPEVAGNVAYWVESGGHIVSFFDAEGEPVAGSERAVDRNALIWREGTTYFRLESRLSPEEARAIAESVE